MAVVGRRVRGKMVYWVAVRLDERDAKGQRKQYWEKVGTDRRAADQLERKYKKQIAAGDFKIGLRPTMSFGEFFETWLEKRANRNAKDDRSIGARFVLSKQWLRLLTLEEIEPKHTQRLVDELKRATSDETGKQLSEKYVSNIYGLYRTACRDARLAGLMPVDPCVLAAKTLRRKPRQGARVNYESDDVLALSSCPDDEAMVFAMLAILTGQRQGEVCGRRWRDWDQHAMPLGCLSVTSQYDDRPLKTETREAGEHPRRVPVHPALDALLRWWWESGFEFTYCRKPTRDDFIVPRTLDGKPHTRSSSYKLWLKACELSGVHNRSLHSTRHTFITLCRRGGAPRDVAERITHNASGNIIDQYTHFDWAPLCQAVLCLKLPVDASVDVSSGTPVLEGQEGWRRRESKSAPVVASVGNRRQIRVFEAAAKADVSPNLPADAASRVTSQPEPTSADTVEECPETAFGCHDLEGPAAWVLEATANLYAARERRLLDEAAPCPR